jgi:hypothetical protein
VAVDDSQSQECEREAVLSCVEVEAKLGVDLREMRQVALAPVRAVRGDRTAQVGSVHVQGASVDERRPDAVAGKRLSDVAGADKVRLLGVGGI